jgi:Colicin D
MHVASTALSTLGTHAETTVAVSAANTTATADVWTGSGSAAAVSSAAQLGGDYSEYGALSVVKSQLLAAAGELHTMTPPQMVTHVQANANRFEYVVDNGINPSVLGALTPRLVDLDTEYFGFMWPNNASAGLRYGAGLDALGAALAGLSALPSMAGGSVAAPAMAAADVAANAGITMASAVMSSAEQAATAVISPASSVVSQASGLLGQAPLSAPATSSSTPTVSPMANVSTHAPAMPSMGQAQTPATGMFLPPSSAAVNASTPAPPVQTMSPVTGSGAAPPGVTSFMKPAEPFKAPPMPSPSGGQATGLSPGMLNASALRGPVTTAPASTAVLTQPRINTSGALATKPLAYVTPDPTRPVQTPPPAHPPLQDSGPIQTFNPPPQPQQSPPHPSPPSHPAPGSGPPPGPSTGSGGPEGSGGPGTQMPGSGLGGAPQAPLQARPLDTRPPPTPPPPSPGEPPLRPPSPPSWAAPPKPPSVQAAQDQLNDLEKLIEHHNSNPPVDKSNLGAVLNYNAEADYYNAWAAQLQGELNSANVQYTPATTAKTAEIPSWVDPNPPPPPKSPRPPYQGPSTPPLIDEVPLQDDLKQIESKYKHASDFGVPEPRGRAGFDKFDDVLRQFLHDPSTLHIDGTYHREPAILNVNPDSGLVVIQSPDGQLISAWKMSPGQLNNALTRGSL